ncbi:killer toxin resistant protein [Coemansia spiralis]|uniref:Killer toxin resistant protein n=2 Tax=Coemansia TaxID=4863 RepID=A0A9W8KXG0_9FUNG|nr:killer toxin resistant protein [Coemansia umbellata]KAJ2620860.1 killer toxin resistant protein [Coemansia sp. RSA 1358]KAJ2675214.1 killer toxin resistant protein [Coemansia spiralis]
MRLSWSLLHALAISAALASTSTASEADSPPIHSLLYSGFVAPPLALEIAEGVAAHNSSAYFTFILKLVDNSALLQQPDSNVYAQAVQWIEQDALLEPFALSLLKLELSAHVYAPLVAAQYQLYNETVVPDIKSTRGEQNFDEACAVWAQYKDKQACTVESLTNLLNIEKFYGDTYIEEAKIEPQQLAFDHVYGSNTQKTNKLVVLYADPRAEGFADMHSHLVTLSDNAEVTYILRYRPWAVTKDSSLPTMLGLSGYGVELVLKSTEYKVIDDRDIDEGDAKPLKHNVTPKMTTQGEDSGENAVLFEVESVPSIKGLSEKQIADLGIQAAQMVISSSNKLAALKQLSQNLPRYAHLLSSVELNETLATSIKRGAIIKQRDVFLINGLEIDDDKLDPFHLHEHLRKEDAAINGLENAGLSQKQAVDILLADSHNSTNGGSDQIAFDMRDQSEDKKTIWWLNDLEKDKRYAGWPSDIQNLKRIFSPGMVQRVRKNVVQAIYALDLSLVESWITIYEDALTDVEHGMPIQYGVVPLTDYNKSEKQTAANEMARFVLYLRRSFKKKEWQSLVRSAVIAHLQSQRNTPGILFTSTMRIVYEAHIKAHKTRDGDTPLGWDDITAAGSLPQWLGKRWESMVKYCARLDLSPTSTPEGLIFVNGVQIALDRNYQKTVLNTYFAQTWDLGQKLRKDELTSEDDIHEFVYGKNTMGSRNAIVYVSDDNPLRVLPLSLPVVQKWMDSNVHYLEFGSGTDQGKQDEEKVKAENGLVSTWIIGDFAGQHVRKTAANALAAAKNNCGMRVAFVHIPSLQSLTSEYRDGGEEDEEQPEGYDIDAPQAIYQLVSSPILQSAPSELAGFVLDYLTNPESAKLQASKIETIGKKLNSLTQLDNDRVDEAEEIFALNKKIVLLLGAEPVERQSCNVVVNGRIIPELTVDSPFSADSFSMLTSYELRERIAPVRSAIGLYITDLKDDTGAERILRITAALEHGKLLHKSDSLFRRSLANVRADIASIATTNPYTYITFNDPTKARLRIQIALDPLSENAQKWTQILQTLLSLPSVSVELWLNPCSELKELPVKRFYRYLWPEKLVFDVSGAIVDPKVVFNGVPTDPLLTLGMDVPSAWLVTAVESIHDLDNIRLSSLKDHVSGIVATYKLVNILVEGHLVDTNLKSPARGLEVRLGTSADPAITDTIVMANLGYLQLKANPGVWKFSLRPGRSADIYKIDHIGSGRWNYAAAKQAADTTKDCQIAVLVTSFNGATIFPLVSKRPGKENEDVLEDADNSTKPKKSSSSKAATQKEKADSASGSGLWGKLKDSIGRGTGLVPSDDSRPHFDVFAVASGHLYERLMSIMILSVLNNTKSHVKFWLIENFLSPSFKAFVPHMADEYGFDYEFVTYKWPHWLNHENEKQRTIWGYKILFLDVLFPLSLDRVIFVDADQIVRADLQELADIDLRGAPYGYVPFCNDRKEIDGYRFWKQGWWRDHLRGKPYHISALYVVDLKRFRQMAAGDRMRGQYQALSRDGNSLANLDQDLPNNMQHIVPIYSLPQEWLWCETWCSDEGLKTARTIDLCNNPMTKEPKLERARRLLPEWEDYDKQVSNFTRVLAQRGKHEGAYIADAEAVAIDQTSDQESRPRATTVEVENQSDVTDAADRNNHDEL